MNVPVVYMGREVWIWMWGGGGNPQRGAFEGVGPEIETFLDPEMAKSAAKYRGNSAKIRSMGKSEEFRKMAKSHFR
jgi:hypothetical protein